MAKKYKMIEVKFHTEVNQCPKLLLKESILTMDWLRYLYENCLDLTINRLYLPEIHYDKIIFQFILSEKHETFYRLKYRNEL